MKITKLLGFLLVGLGLILIVLPAALPATIVHQRGLQFEAREDGCGAAIVAALDRSDLACGQTARQRLLITTAAGAVVMVAGLVLAGEPETRYRSRVSLRS